jgi:hypothetical protein
MAHQLLRPLDTTSQPHRPALACFRRLLPWSASAQSDVQKSRNSHTVKSSLPSEVVMITNGASREVQSTVRSKEHRSTIGTQ